MKLSAIAARVKPEKKTMLAMSILAVLLFTHCVRPFTVILGLLLLYPVLRYLFYDDPQGQRINRDVKMTAFFVFGLIYSIVSTVYIYPDIMENYWFGKLNYGDTNYVHQITVIVFVIVGWFSLLLGQKRGGCLSAFLISIVYIANNIMYRIRGRYISVDDLSYIKTAAFYGKNYKLFEWKDLIYVVFAIIITTVYIKTLDRLQEGESKGFFKDNKVMIFSNIISTIMLSALFVMYTPEPISYFVQSCRDSLKNFDTKDMYQYSKDYSAIGKTKESPNIVFVLSEAYADLAYTFRDDTLNSHYNALNALKSESLVSGYMYCDEIGGGTINAEFSALTGISTKATATGGYLYQNYAQQDIISLPAILKSAGYYTVGINSATMTGYNRKNGWQMYNFDKTISKEDIAVQEQRRWVGMDDHVLYDLALKNIKDIDEPTFQYLVTIQNHGPYTNDKFGSDKGEYLAFQDYSTEQLTSFVDELKENKEPTILVYFGDHTPSLDHINDAEELAHHTPFLIWCNYKTDYEKRTVDLISPIYLGMYVSEIIGLDNKWYSDLSALYEEYPVIVFENDGKDESKKYYLDEKSSEKYKIYIYSCLNMLLN